VFITTNMCGNLWDCDTLNSFHNSIFWKFWFVSCHHLFSLFSYLCW